MNLKILKPFISSRITQNLIDSCQAHLPMHFALNIELISSCDTGVMIDSEPHLSRTSKTSFLFDPLTFRVLTGCSAFPCNLSFGVNICHLSANHVMPNNDFQDRFES